MTVTDAALLVGILGHGVIGYGAIKPDFSKAEEVARPLADKLGLSLPELADGVLKVAVSGMLIAIEQLLARAGVHASELTLMPFGGAGPMLGALLAEAAGMKRMLVPAAPGTLCALGAAAAPIRRDTMRTVLLPLDDDTLASIRKTFVELEAEAKTAVIDMVGPGDSLVQRAADLRYKGQSFEITVPVSEADGTADIVANFHVAYERAFGHSDRDTPVQVVNLRVSNARPAPEIRFPEREATPHAAKSQRMAQVHVGGGDRMAALYDRAALDPGATLAGPAIILQDDTTLFVPQGWTASVDRFSNIVMEQA